MACVAGPSGRTPDRLEPLAPASACVPISRVSSATSTGSSSNISSTSSSGGSNLTATTTSPPATSPKVGAAHPPAPSPQPTTSSVSRPALGRTQRHSIQGQSSSNVRPKRPSGGMQKSNSSYGFPLGPTEAHHSHASARSNSTSRRAASPPSPRALNESHSHRPRHHSTLSSAAVPTSRAWASEASHLSKSTRASGRHEELEAKVVLLGDQGVGKTSIIHRYIHDNFDTATQSTIGANFMAKRLVVDDCVVKIQLWDTAGQERFRSMAPLYYRGALAAILVYDVTSMRSFREIKTWLEDLRQREPETIITVVGTKADLPESLHQVSLEYAQQNVAEWCWQLDHPEEAFDEEEEEERTSAPLSRDRSRSKTPTVSHAPSPALSRASSSRAVESLGMVRSKTAGNIPSESSSSDGASMARSGSAISLALNGFGIGRAGGSSQSSSSRAVERKKLEARERRERALATCQVQVSEVSAKDSWGIEEAFLDVARELLEKRQMIERHRQLRSKDSIIIDKSSTQEAVNTNSWTCCG